MVKSPRLKRPQSLGRRFTNAVWLMLMLSNCLSDTCVCTHRSVRLSVLLQKRLSAWTALTQGSQRAANQWTGCSWDTQRSLDGTAVSTSHPQGSGNIPEEEIERVQRSEDVGEHFQILPSRYDTAFLQFPKQNQISQNSSSEWGDSRGWGAVGSWWLLRKGDSISLGLWPLSCSSVG